MDVPIQSPVPLIYCNPLPLPNYQQGRALARGRYKGASYREMADPTVIRWQGRWYLFPSCGMLWESADMVTWEYHAIEPFDPGYAPTVVQHGEWLYMTASWDETAIWRSRHPRGPWQRLGTLGRDADNNATWLKDHNGEAVRWGDPCLFVDEDGAMYCYCNLVKPSPPGSRWHLQDCEGEIFGVRLRDDDPTRFADAPVKLIKFNPAHRWERAGEFNEKPGPKILEGAWMTGAKGRYYLQYSANGTQFTTYALGCYSGDHPLGPFTCQQRNPILIHRGGLVNGCAHHSIVEGPDGRLWCFYTTLVGISHSNERRIGMDPVAFDGNGEMYIEGPTETPQYITIPATAPAEPLSVHGKATASSSAPGRCPRYAVDNQIRTWWEAAETITPQWLQVEVDPDHAFQVSAVRILFADIGLDYPAGIVPGPYRYTIQSSLNALEWHTLYDAGDNAVDRHIAFHSFPAETVRYVRLNILSAPPGMRIGVWEFTVFGNSYQS